MSFTADGGGGSVDPVYLDCEGALLEIFPTNYNCTYTCALIGSPSESGTEQLDNKVIKPSSITMTGIVKYEHKSVFHQIRRNMLKLKLGEIKCTFYSKAASCTDMLVEQLEEIGESNRYDAMEIKVKLHEYLVHNMKKKKKK